MMQNGGAVKDPRPGRKPDRPFHKDFPASAWKPNMISFMVMIRSPNP